jgi:hypothetical protein
MIGAELWALMCLPDLAQVHKPSSYHEGGHDIKDSSHTEMEPSDINSSLGSINNGSSNSASIGSRILFQGGGKVDKVLTPGSGIFSPVKISGFVDCYCYA